MARPILQAGLLNTCNNKLDLWVVLQRWYTKTYSSQLLSTSAGENILYQLIWYLNFFDSLVSLIFTSPQNKICIPDNVKCFGQCKTDFSANVLFYFLVSVRKYEAKINFYLDQFFYSSELPDKQKGYSGCPKPHGSFLSSSYIS